ESPRWHQCGRLGESTAERAAATSASYTELPADRPAARRKPGHARTGSGTAGGSGWRRWLRAHMAWAGWASVGAALVVIGVILGSALSGSSAPTTSSNGGVPSPPPAPPPACR